MTDELTLPPETTLGNELRARRGLLQHLEQVRLRVSPPASLQAADDQLEARVARLDPALDAVDLARWPEGAVALADRAIELAGAIADLLAAVVTRDERSEERHSVPFKAAPNMIEASNVGAQAPVDDLAAAWRDDHAPLQSWRRILDHQLREAHHGVRCAMNGSSVYDNDAQSNQAPVVSLLAHVLALVTWLQRKPDRDHR
jgi:hypothetical protein